MAVVAMCVECDWSL